MSNKLTLSALIRHKSSSGSGENQICLAPRGFALWTSNRVLPLYPAGGVGSPQTPLLVETPFFAISARLRRELPNFTFYRQSEHTLWSLLLLVNLNVFLKNSTPGEFAYVKHSDRVGIIALKFHRSGSQFIFKRSFCLRRRRGILNSLLSTNQVITVTFIKALAIFG